MLKNLSYFNKQTKRDIDQLVGKAFSLFERLRMGGSGSPKFLVVDASEEIWQKLDRTNTTKTCNIELRPGGIIVGFRSGYEVWAWVIPFKALEIKKNDHQFNISDSSSYIKIQYAYLSDSKKSFFEKIEKAVQNTNV